MLREPVASSLELIWVWFSANTAATNLQCGNEPDPKPSTKSPGLRIETNRLFGGVDLRPALFFVLLFST